MSALTFVCPQSGNTIDAGIETDVFSLASARTASIRVRCPHCQEEHAFLVEDGQLENAA